MNKLKPVCVLLILTLTLTACMDPELSEVTSEAKKPPPPPASQPLAWATDTTGSLTRQSPYHLWSFEVLANDTVEVQLSGDRDTYVAIVVPTGTLPVVASNDDCSPGTTSSCVTATLTTGGVYAVMVTSHQYATTGRSLALDYTVRLDLTGRDCTSTRDCLANQYCLSPDGACYSGGRCTEMPATCSNVDQPVCGCDGVTYTNACTAASAGASVGSEGGCGQGAGETCGGIANLQCTEGLVCDYSANTVCSADPGGVCTEPTPRLCTNEFAPVCGCDGVTYLNDCYRRSANVPLDHTGSCN